MVRLSINGHEDPGLVCSSPPQECTIPTEAFMQINGKGWPLTHPSINLLPHEHTRPVSMAATAFAARAGTHAINAQHSNRGLQPRSLSQTSGSATKCRRTIIPGASDEKKEESMVEWVTRAIFSIFSPASSEDTAPDFTHTGTPFTGEILSPDDARRLARIEQVIGKVKSDAPEAEQQEKAQRDENLGEYLAKAASQAFKQPEAKEDEVRAVCMPFCGLGFRSVSPNEGDGMAPADLQEHGVQLVGDAADAGAEEEIGTGRAGGEHCQDGGGEDPRRDGEVLRRRGGPVMPPSPLSLRKSPLSFWPSLL